MSAWYLLHCKARQEARAKLNIENQGYVTCYPTLQVEKLVAGKRKIVAEPLFPNYLFIQLDPDQANFNALRSTRGVNGFVRFGGKPTKVPNKVIQHLQSLEDTGQEQIAESMFKPGTPVEITEGPFAGLPAVYQLRKGEERCLILLEMMGKQQQLLIKENQLKNP